PHWSWARLLKQVFALDMARCPWCPQGTRRVIAALTPRKVIRKILQHLKLGADPPPIAPARVRQEAFAWPLPDRAWGVADPSLIAGSWVLHSPCLVLRLRCPLSLSVGGEAWPSYVSVPPRRPAAPGVLHPSQ